jgi:hypothetical protein
MKYKFVRTWGRHKSGDLKKLPFVTSLPEWKTSLDEEDV